MMGATADGPKELNALEAGIRESEQLWTSMIVDLKSRGLAIDPKLAIADDGALGFWAAMRKEPRESEYRPLTPGGEQIGFRCTGRGLIAARRRATIGTHLAPLIASGQYRQGRWNMSTRAIISENLPLLHELPALLPAMGAIGEQWDSDTIPRPKVFEPQIVEKLIRLTPTKMRKRFREKLAGMLAHPIIDRMAKANWDEKYARERDRNRKRYTRAWYRKIGDPLPPPAGRLRGRRRAESTWCGRFDYMLSEVRKELQRDPLHLRKRDDALALAGRIILMAWFVTDPDASARIPRLTAWQDLPWEVRHRGERWDGRVFWDDAEAPPGGVPETRRLLQGVMFGGRDGHMWLELLRDAVATWKRLAGDELAATSIPTTPQTEGVWTRGLRMKVIGTILGCEGRRRTVEPKLKALNSELHELDSKNFKVRVDGMDKTYKAEFEKAGVMG